MSDSVRPHRRQPTRVPHSWDSPGKNTRVGCHFLLQCMKVKSESEVPQSCLTLCNPMECSLPGSSVHGILKARVLEWGAMLILKKKRDFKSRIQVLTLINWKKESKLNSKQVEGSHMLFLRDDKQNGQNFCYVH